MRSLTIHCLALHVFLATLVPAQETKRVTNAASVSSWLKAQDKDGDGKIARGESTGAMKRFFRRNDVDRDGFLDRSELTALAKRLDRNARRRGANSGRGKRRDNTTTDQLREQVGAQLEFEADVAYRQGDSERWRLDLFYPKTKSQELRPGLVFVHGGGWKNGNKRRGIFLQGAIEYAKKGYVTITVNYRLIDEAPMPACIEDVKCAVRWLRANAAKYQLDPKRIGAFGNSAGAHLVSMLGLSDDGKSLSSEAPHRDQSSVVQAVCASATPTDFLGFGKRNNRKVAAGGLFAGSREGLEQRLRDASPITHVRADAPPFLLIHGSRDRLVDVAQADALCKALKAAGAKDVTFMRIEGAGHGVFNQHRKKTKPAMEAFFARTLGLEPAVTGKNPVEKDKRRL